MTKMTFKELREGSGMSRGQFAEHFEIPYRTVQNWELGLRECPEYLLKLIQFKLDNEKKAGE
jgi:DNA-binding transcriptional regulator YiaG